MNESPSSSPSPLDRWCRPTAKMIAKKRKKDRESDAAYTEEVKQCPRRHSRSRKMEDGVQRGFGCVRRVNRVTSVANSRRAQKNVTQISNALWERHWERERERVGNEVEVAPFALRHAGVLLCVGVCLSLFCLFSVDLLLSLVSFSLWCCRRRCLRWLWNTFITSVSAQNRMHVIRADWRADKRWAFVLIVRRSVSFAPSPAHLSPTPYPCHSLSLSLGNTD